MSWRARLKATLLLGVLTLVACHFALNLQQNGKTYLQADAYTHLTAKRPYQYRVLMAPVLGTLIEALSLERPRRLLGRLPVYVSTPEAAAYAVINGVGFFASCLLMLAIARRALRSAAGVRLALALYLAMAYLFFCLNPNVAFILPYDVPALALSQACILAILTRRWLWLYPLFVLATVNRESSFLVIVFLAARVLGVRPLPGRQLLQVAGLAGVWLAVKAGLYLRFSELPSDEGLRLLYNLRALAKPWQWPALLPLLASVGLTLRALRSEVEQREWAITAGLGFALIFLVGQLIETRAFADLMVFFTVAITRGSMRLPVVARVEPRLATDRATDRAMDRALDRSPTIDSSLDDRMST